MGKYTFHLKHWKLTDFFHFFCCFLGSLISNTPHTCIQFYMNIGFFILTHRFFRQRLRHIQAKNCLMNLMFYNMRITFRKCISQNQDWFFNPCLAKFHCFIYCCSCKSPQIITRFNKTRNWYRSMPIGICFYHCHDFRSIWNIFTHLIKVEQYCI